MIDNKERDQLDFYLKRTPAIISAITASILLMFKIHGSDVSLSVFHNLMLLTGALFVLPRIEFGGSDQTYRIGKNLFAYTFLLTTCLIAVFDVLGFVDVSDDWFAAIATLCGVMFGVNKVNLSHESMTKFVQTLKNIEPKPASSKPKPLSTINSLAKWALSNVGIKEKPGRGSHPTIKDWLDSMNWGKKYPTFDDDDEPWCSLFPNAGAKHLGLQYSDSPAAKSWMKVGRKISKEDVWDGRYPKESGIVAVFHRKYKSPDPKTGPGHVSIFIEPIDGTKFRTVDGNLSNSTKEDVKDINDPFFIEFRLLLYTLT